MNYMKSIKNIILLYKDNNDFVNDLLAQYKLTTIAKLDKHISDLENIKKSNKYINDKLEEINNTLEESYMVIKSKTNRKNNWTMGNW